MLAATWWWVVPLALLARYGVSVIPYTESAAVTTSVTGLSETLRGTENWVSYLVVDGQPWWQPGYRIVTGALPNLLTGVLAGLGLAGLLRPRLPGRRFLLCLLLTGVVIISAGHLSSLGGPLAGPVDHLINGPASAFRNLRKFDPLIRLPLSSASPTCWRRCACPGCGRRWPLPPRWPSAAWRCPRTPAGWPRPAPSARSRATG